MKGANFIRVGCNRLTGEIVHHLLDVICGGHKFVKRSTFASELFAGVAAADSLIPLATTLHELATGPLPKRVYCVSAQH